MKFSDSSGFKSSMDSYVMRMVRTLTMPISTGVRKMKNMVGANSIARRATNEMMKQMKELKEAPKSLSEYILLGDHYVAKRLLFVLLILAFLLPAIFINYAWPPLQRAMFTRKMPIDCPQITDYTGNHGWGEG